MNGFISYNDPYDIIRIQNNSEVPGYSSVIGSWASGYSIVNGNVTLHDRSIQSAAVLTLF